ncbi:cadherin-like beta sandwich domain-containing protein [Paenibacillus agricola]|uniref:cadherin-like beta sandwich domain-containing protein n=1 Tax=Paenibacillus agricola TaxID=2716264 RepID=UPI0028937F9D|nr:cadherin-like beta sandwich domain-containing protein [Paenibacillus agricola]
MRKLWNIRLAKLLIAVLLLQCMPFLPGGLSAAHANGTVTEQTYSNGNNTVQSNTYSVITPMSRFTMNKTVSSQITDYKWERVTVNLPPDARQAASMVYDENADNVVMFGGQGNSGLFDETWIWDGRQKSWKEILNLSPKPSNRQGAVMAYDAVSKKVLLFGGEGQSGVLGDTWLWNGTDATWEEVTGLISHPSARGGAQLAYDGEQLVLFGGYTGSGNSKTPLGDTWLWDGAAWTQAQPDQSPPAAYGGKMVYDGNTAVQYGGNIGSITASYVGQISTKTFTHDDSSPLLWQWDRAAKSWTSTNGPETYGRWGQTMAYDGRRVVLFSGERDYVHMYDPSLVEKLKLPSSMYPPTRGDYAYGWTGSNWERYPLNLSTETVYQSNMDKDGKVYDVQMDPNQLPFPLSYASMAFDGKNFVVFGGNRSQISIMDKVFGSVVGSKPAGNMNETWVFGFTPPTGPGVKFDVEQADPDNPDYPVIYNFDTQKVNDTVSVITNVYDNGTRTISSQGVEYRKKGDSAWIKVPYTGSIPEVPAPFTVTITGLVWHQDYEVRGYAVNEIGTSYTTTKDFKMEKDPNLLPPDVVFDRVGASFLHIKDKKRLVAVGTGITNLLRKPLNNINYYLQSQNGNKPTYKLDYNVLNTRQLELTWTQELPPGKYDVHLEHVDYNPYVFTEGLTVTALDFYKPRNFARVEVPSTSASNEVNSLVLQGPFVEDPSKANEYVLTDTSEVVSINESVMFKGSRLVVTKDIEAGKATITGEGRLYVNGGGALGANLSYTIQEGAFTISSDRFAIDLNSSVATDYLNIDMPVKASSLIFTKDGLRLTGDLQIGLQVGNQKVTDSVKVEEMKFRNNRFDLSGTFTMKNSFKVGPLNVSDTKFVMDSRIPYVGVQGKGSLPDTDLSFDLNMKTKQGRLDGVNFGMYRKTKLASTGLQVNYLFGNVDKLAEKTQIPQKFSVTGSVMDVIVPELKHPQVDYKFNLIGTDSIDMDLSSYGFSASGTEYYYWLPVKNMNMQTVVNPTTAGIKGLSTPGFASKGEINLSEVVKGAITTQSFNKKGFNGVIKGNVYVPKGIPRIGGATVSNVALSVNETGIYGTFKHNGVGANLKYTFANNTILFEVEAEPPKKKWWEKALDFMDSVSDFMDAAEPWLDIAEELFLMKPDSGKQVTIAAANPLKRVFDLTPISLSFQTEDTAQTEVKARIVDGKLTTLDRTPLMTTETNGSSGKLTAGFTVDRSYNSLITLTGDQRSAVLSVPAASGQISEQIVLPEVFYDAASDTTFMRVLLHAGDWKLVTNGNSRILVNELLFASESLTLDLLAGLWAQTPERSVTSITVEERGSYVLKMGAAQDKAIVYKPDGRPYSLQTAQNQPDWNAYQDANGNLYALLNAVEAGTWIVSAGTSTTAVLNTVPSQTTIGDVVQWMQAQAYPTAFQMRQTGNLQAIVEIYGADAQTKLYTPKGELYTLQLDPNQSGMNAIYDDMQHKLTVLLTDVEMSGQWKVVSSSFTSIIAYESSRKLKSIKPLMMEGRFGKYFQISENGNYMLTVSGGDANTVITAPDGSTYTLNFEAPNGNAYLQPAADRLPSAGSGGDPLQQTQINTPNPVHDGRDMLYVSLLDAPAGKWMVQNTKKVELQIQKLIALPAIKASVSPVSVAVNRIHVSWSMENAAPGTEVRVMLTDSAENDIGEVVAEGLPAYGSTTLDIPAMTMPGTYYLSVEGAKTGNAPVYAIAEGTVEVTAPYTLNAPEQPEVLSTGNGEVSLRFASISGDVTAYRIWVSGGANGQAAAPIMDFTPQTGNWQNAVVTGLPAGASYTFAVSAIGQEQGRLVLSPQSAIVASELPVPQPAAMGVSLDSGSHVSSERTYTAFDGTVETLLLTTAEQASLKVMTDQNTSLVLSVNGEQLGSGQVSANGTYAFVLHTLLNVSMLKEREYNLLIEAVNEKGDRSTVYRKLVVDRTGPLLIASGGDDAQGKPIALNGTVTADSKVYITGQTDAGAKLVINGINVPLNDEGRFVYYAPLDWVTQADRNVIKITASDMIGNKTESGFEVLRDVVGAIPDYPGDLAALTTGSATMSTPYTFGTTSYQALAYSDKVRVYAVPMAASSVVSVDGQALPESGYVDVDVPATGRNVQIWVHPSNASDKLYTLQIHKTGSSVAVLRTLKLKNTTALQTGEDLAAQAFTGAEESYTVHVGNTVDSVTLTPGALDAGSGIKVKGQAVQNGQASQTIQLQVGENQIPVAVTSPDSKETRSYKVVVLREPSSDARLQQLGLATNGAELVSAFNPATLNYQVLVPYATGAFTLLPVAEQLDATIHIEGQAVTKGTALSIPFTKAAQTFAIEVSAQDGTKLTYTISVLRQQASPVQPPLLASLMAGAGLDSAFTPYKLNYGTIGKTTNSGTSVTAISNDPLAKVTVKGVSLKGGGSFTTNLDMGLNTIIVSVESADLTTSQTYSIDVERIRNQSAASAPNERHTTISGGAGGWTDQTSIVRTSTEEGRIIDTVKLDAEIARSILEKAVQNKDRIARIYLTDVPDMPSDEWIVNMNTDFVSLLADGGLSLQIVMPDAQLTLSAASLQQMAKDGKDAYFRVVPIRDSAERSEVKSRVQTAELVQNVAGSQPVAIIGQPIMIETNYSGYTTELLLPLNNMALPENGAAANQILSELAVYIEHSDGNKALSQGEIRYDADGKLVGIAIEINKFSTFTVIQKNGADAVLQPYLNGYQDGTFRPSQAITRAELATILHRVGVRNSSDEAVTAQETGYPDVAQGHWAAIAITHMQSVGMMLGDNNGQFRPDDAITRGELATIAARLISAAAAGLASTGDYSDTQGHWAFEAIKKASQSGILEGYPDGTFQPESKLNRAEAVKVLNRLFERPTAGVKASSWPDVPQDHWAIQEIESASGTVRLVSDGSVLVTPNH